MAPIHKSVRSRSLSENDVTSKAESVDHSDHTDESSSNQLGVSAELTPKSRIRRMSERHLSHQSTQEDNDNRVEQNENDCPIEDEPIQTTQDDKEENEVFDDHGRHSEKDEEGPKNFVQKRTRGRPRKSFVTTTEEPMPTRKSSRQMLRNTRVAVEDESRIRRRDKIKSVDRYSPEPIEVKRPRKSHPIPLIDPVHSDSDSENTVSKTLHPTLLPTKKMLLKRSANESLDCDDDADPSSNVFIVDVKKDMADGKVLLTLTDGASYCIETKNSHQSFDDSDFGADEDDSKDKDYKDTSSLRRKSGKGKLLPHEGDVVNSVYNIKTVAIQATGIKMPKKIRKANRHQQQMQTNTLSPVPSDETFTTKITTPGGPAGKGTVTYITTPKSVSLTPASTYSRITSSKRNYQNTQAKFLNEGPDLSECSSEDINSQFELLADRVLLVSSDLPLEHSITSSGEQNQPTSRDRKALFSQVISPITTDLICLLCPKVSFRDESLLIDHYEHTHELKVDRKAAKFSEDIVYVCLPENVIMKLRDPQESTSVMLNASCQYCGDDVCLDTLENMESHYEKVHRKSIQLVEQEKILDMHRHLRCCVCDNESNDFASHHRHMKEVHRMHTLVCRACTFTTSDPNRLSTHFRAKHLIGLRSQNMQCHFCNGICIGIERMNKHLQSAHCVQTGPNEFSCTVCLQPHGSGEQLLQHSWNCPGKAGRDELLHSHHLRPHHFAHHTLHHPTLPPQSLAGTPTFEAVDSVSNTTICTSTSISKSSHPECFLCGRKFDTSDKLDLHLHHVHARWGNRIVLNDTFLMVQHKDGKTDLMPSQEHTDSIGLDNLPNNRLLEEIGAKTQFGYYCHKCECVIRIYQLFYLHMYNLHKQWKQFECRISTCKQVFYSANDFRKHVQDTQHPQYSVIERPLDSIACHICDSYFLNEQQMEKHNLSDEHHARLNKSIEKTLVKTTEARNFKCKTCHTWFGLMDSFVYHMENESHKHGCPHCGLHFALPSSRRTHIQSVHADRADICELCNEKQGTKERLFAHLVSHNLVFECDKCMRKFYQREQLNNHMETHGEPVDCPWPACGKRINRASLSNHYRAHKMEQQLRCNLCDKSFNTKHQFTSHQETQHSLQDVPDKVNLTAPPASFPHHRRPSSTLTQQRKIPSVVTHQIASRPTLPKIIAQSNSHTKMASIAKSKTQLISNSKPAFMIQSTSQPISHSVSRSLRHPTPQPATQPTLKLAHQTESRSVPQIVPELILQSSSQRASYNHHNQPKALNTLIPKAVPSQMSTTTLITITTPSAQPSAPPLVHHSAQRNQRAFVSRSSTFQNSYPHIRSPVRNQVEKLEKITCCACNQVFTNTDDLSFHQCVVPVVTITGPKDLANLLTEDKAPDVIDLKDDDDSNDKIMVDLIKPITSVSNTIRPAYKRLATESSGGQRQISNYRDPKCLDMQNRVKRTYSTANRHRVHKKIETSSASPSTQLNVNGSQEQLHRHYQHQHHYRHSQKQSQSQSNSSSSLAARPRQQHYLIETPGHPPQLILADSDAFQMDPEQLQALLHEQQRLQSGNETRSDYATDEPESTITSNSNEELLDCLPPEQVEAAEKLAEQAALEGGQLIMIQHPDGQCVQICVPQGMDIDEVLKSLNQNWPLDQPLSESEELSTANEDNKHNDASRTQSIVTPSLGQPPLINLDETDETDPDSEPISCETEATPQTATELIEQVHLIEDDHSQIYLTEDPQPNEIEMLDSATHHRTSPVTGSELLDTAIAQSFADPGSFDLTSNQPTDLEGLTMDTIDGQTIELDGQQLLTAEQAAQLIQLADQQQITLDPSLLTDAEGQIPDGEQQLIYLPVNEDGTCAIDAASFAMLTCNGEMPIIVSSDNQLPAS